MVLLNASAKKIIDTNSKLVENQNKLLEQNRSQEDDKADLKKRIDELEGQLRQHVSEEVKLLQAETRQRREHIELTADMDDVALMAWLDQEMEKTRLYTDTNLTLKTLANTLGLTQRRLAALFKNHPKYANLGDYLNEKRFILACRLLREQQRDNPNRRGASRHTRQRHSGQGHRELQCQRPFGEIRLRPNGCHNLHPARREGLCRGHRG